MFHAYASPFYLKYTTNKIFVKEALPCLKAGAVPHIQLAAIKKTPGRAGAVNG